MLVSTKSFDVDVDADIGDGVDVNGGGGGGGGPDDNDDNNDDYVEYDDDVD